MRTEEARRFVDVAAMPFSKILCGNLESELANPHDSANVGVGAESAFSAPADAVRSHSTDTMEWTRDDVARVLKQFVRIEFSLRSGDGRLVIDETRVVARRQRTEVIDFDGSLVEVLDRIKHAYIRAMSTAPPTPRRELSTPTLGREQYEIRCVAPTVAVAPIVHGKPTRNAASAQDSRRDWRGTVGQKLTRMLRLLEEEGIPDSESVVVVDKVKMPVVVAIEKRRQDRVIVRNRLQQARSDAGRLKSGSRGTRSIRVTTENAIARLRAEDDALTEAIQHGVRTRAYRRGIDHLLDLFTETEAIASDIFGLRNRHSF